MKGEVDELNILNINIDIEEAFAEAATDYAKEAGYLIKNANLPSGKADFNLASTIKDAASDLELMIRGSGSNMKKLGRQCHLRFRGHRQY